MFFLSTPNITAPTTEPTTKATRYIKGFVITGNTNNPTCGALDPHPNAIYKAPATADPITQEGITLAGSPAANGIAPSVINDAPIT